LYFDFLFKYIQKIILMCECYFFETSYFSPSKGVFGFS